MAIQITPKGDPYRSFIGTKVLFVRGQLLIIRITKMIFI